MTLKRLPAVILRFGPHATFIQVRPILLRIVQESGQAIVVDLPSERLMGKDSIHDPLIMAQPDPDIPGDSLMSVIERGSMANIPILDMDTLLVQAVTRMEWTGVAPMVTCYEVHGHAVAQSMDTRFYRDHGGVIFAIRVPRSRPYQPTYTNSTRFPGLAAVPPPAGFQVDNIPAPPPGTPIYPLTPSQEHAASLRTLRSQGKASGTLKEITKAMVQRPGDFMTDLLAGVARPSAVDAYIAAWHAHPEPGCTLSVWLGLTDWEYEAFVKSEAALEQIVAQRKATPDQKPTVTITETDHSTHANEPPPKDVSFDPHATGPVRNPVQIVNTAAAVERVMGQPQKPTDSTGERT